MAIHPSARVASTAKIHPGAEIGHGVEIADFVVVEDEVTIGANTRLEPHVVIKRWTTLGSDNKVSTGTVLGTDPLDKSFGGERSYLRIGNGNIIREHYTISRGTEPDSITEIGDNNYIMTSGHIAHNCKVGSNNVICSCALIAGYVEIEDWAFISGGVGVQQFARVGSMVMIAGNSGVNVDAPPYFLYAGFRIEPKGVNVVGLRRAGLDTEQIRHLKQAFRVLYRSSLPLKDALERIQNDLLNEHTQHLIDFVRSSKCGISR
jgi:UDP-N-acetylglucosamine acyltransferase